MSVKRLAISLLVLLIFVVSLPVLAQSPNELQQVEIQQDEVEEVEQLDILDRILHLTQLFAGVVVGLFAAFAGALVWMSRASAKPLAQLIPQEMMLKAFDLALSVSKLTPSTKDDEALEELKAQLLADVYNSVDDAVTRAFERVVEEESESPSR